jgi:hypothetical protein
MHGSPAVYSLLLCYLGLGTSTLPGGKRCWLQAPVAPATLRLVCLLACPGRYQLAWSALSLLSSRFEFDRVGAVIGPAFLATRALPPLASRISAFDTATGLFGYYLARELPVGGEPLLSIMFTVRTVICGCSAWQYSTAC